MRTTLVVLALAVAPPVWAAHPGARPGEAFTFKFFLGPVEGGRARMSVGEPVAAEGRRLIAVHGEAMTNPVVSLILQMKDDYKLVFDAATLLPRSVSEVEEGTRQHRITTRMDGRTAEVDYWTPHKKVKGRRLLPRIVRDPLSGLFALRAMPLHDGARFSLDILDSNALWRVAATVHRGARVRLAKDGPSATALPAIRIDGIAHRIDDSGKPRPQFKPRQISVWLSDDPLHVLLRMEADSDFGRCTLELTSYVPARVAVEERPPRLPGIELQ